jgi:hypothetical protein
LKGAPYTLPGSTVIALGVEITGMIWITKWGFGGGGSTAKVKKESMSDDIKL